MPGCDRNGEGRDGCGRIGCSKCYPMMEDKMNDLCGSCGKPNHPGGCKVGPNTPEQNKALEAYANRAKPKCGICMSPDHEVSYCPHATRPRTVDGVIRDVKPDADFLYIGGLHPAMADLLRECIKIQGSKGRDYTEGSDDRLNNFREAGVETDTPMEKVWYVYFFKHWKAVRSWVRFGQVESEPIRGRIVDCINYLLLLHLIVLEKDPKQD